MLSIVGPAIFKIFALFALVRVIRFTLLSTQQMEKRSLNASVGVESQIACIENKLEISWLRMQRLKS